MVWAKPTTRRDDKHISFGIYEAYIRGLMVDYETNVMDYSILISRHGNWRKRFPHHRPFVAGISLTEDQQCKLLVILLLFAFSINSRDYPSLRHPLMSHVTTRSPYIVYTKRKQFNYRTLNEYIAQCIIFSKRESPSQRTSNANC